MAPIRILVVDDSIVIRIAPPDALDTGIIRKSDEPWWVTMAHDGSVLRTGAKSGATLTAMLSDSA